MKDHTIIGTAGHIDHGKTSLIKALTGIDTDRLKDEQLRGMTIDLGFAYWQDSVTIIDVPGHERFIRNMVAGVSTIDFFLFVIAADDGIMPQTIEHLDILRIFNIRKGLIVITKIDLVDNEWLELVLSEVKELLKNYGLSDLSIMKVSTVNGDGIDDLKEAIFKSIAGLQDIKDDMLFRLSIDRSFTMKGFGTVVTGTVLNGFIGKGEQVEILPQVKTVTIRGIQSHTHIVTGVKKGDRAAINLQGISKDEVTRGDQLVARNTLLPSNNFLGLIHTVSKIPHKVKNSCKITVHCGTAMRIGRLFWYDSDKYIVENRTFHVRIQTDAPLAITKDDAFLIRLHSPVYTLGGGTIFDVMPSNYSTLRKEWQSCFSVLKSSDIAVVAEYYIRSSGNKPLTISMLITKFFKSKHHLVSILQRLQQSGNIVAFKTKGDPSYMHNTAVESMMKRFKTFLETFHKEHSAKPGANLQEISRGTGYTWLDIEIIEDILQKMLMLNHLKRKESHYSLPAFTIKINENLGTLKEELISFFLDTVYTPPAINEIAEKFAIQQQEAINLCKLVERENVLINIRTFYLHRDNWQKLLLFLKSHFNAHETLSVNDLKDFLQTSRKFTIPIFEYLDIKQYTQRKGDIRIAGKQLF